MIGLIIGGFVIVACIIVMILLRTAKRADIESGAEPSLGQEDNFVIMENAEEIEEVSE